MKRASVTRGWALAATALALAGCSLAPPYTPPATPIAQAYKEQGPWTPAAPADAQPRGQWWAMFSDPVLDDLEARAEKANPTLAAAVAAYDQARALASQARAGLVPEVDGNALANRQRRSDNEPLRVGGPDAFSTAQAGVSVAYEIDLWGRLRNLARGAGQRAQASEADMRSARLSLQADLADDYMTLRGQDSQIRLLDDTVAAYSRALDLTKILHNGGNATGLDVARAETQLSSAKAQRTDVGAQRALMEHAIAALVGESASNFSLPAVDKALPQPTVAVSAPSVLLQRRPDIAAAERRAAAANADVGVARAALFPALTLDGTAGWQNAAAGNLLSAPNTFWLIGPQLAGAIFDGGRRAAGVRASKAAFEEASANYRGVVLGAFRDVEDQMALANRLAVEAKDADDAVTAAQRTVDLANIRYRQGVATYLDVVTAQTAALTAEQTAIQLTTRRLQASVDLTRALGGAWG
ncbi:MAG TPA: efflux transporter outer membrane subunit [Phenylobacterium sp.]|uniref:efflux transporter outer membrane subunit n=1 Tax=Phenylobacterium sp. TaxID=1871053 RepID=UPI002D494FE2|nr:efflux transporter outer membrane subunit [Phenylobacterium sp.]HZZ70139.1 efflux transporter outer membrane subunit [Phenylobacterium sp.]